MEKVTSLEQQMNEEEEEEEDSNQGSQIDSEGEVDLKVDISGNTHSPKENSGAPDIIPAPNNKLTVIASHRTDNTGKSKRTSPKNKLSGIDDDEPTNNSKSKQKKRVLIKGNKKLSSMKAKETDNATSGEEGGLKGKKSMIEIKARLEKVENYLQERFNWLKLPIEKKYARPVKEKRSTHSSISPVRS